LTGAVVPGQSRHAARADARERRKMAPRRLEIVIAEFLSEGR